MRITHHSLRMAHDNRAYGRSRFPLLGVCFLTMALTPAAFADIPPFAARYTLSRSGIPLGENIRTLGKSDGAFLYQSVTRASGLLARFIREELIERSEWVYEGAAPDTRIRPLEYQSRREKGKKEKWIRQIFDWEKSTTTSINSARSWRMPLKPDSQDRLSYQLAIMDDLQKGRKNLDYPIVDSDKTKTYRFVILGEEQLKTAIGPLRTLKIQRTGDKRMTTVWCAIDLHYLPVALEQDDDEDGHLTMKIESVQGL